MRKNEMQNSFMPCSQRITNIYLLSICSMFVFVLCCVLLWHCILLNKYTTSVLSNVYRHSMYSRVCSRCDHYTQSVFIHKLNVHKMYTKIIICRYFVCICTFIHSVSYRARNVYACCTNTFASIHDNKIAIGWKNRGMRMSRCSSTYKINSIA